MRYAHRGAGPCCWMLIGCGVMLTGCTAIEPDADASGSSNTQAKIVPGETLGNTALQQDSLLQVYMAAATKMPDEGCSGKDFRVLDTKVTDQPKEVEGAAVFTRWAEMWTVGGCGNTVDVDVTYMQHFQKGTSITAE